MLASLRPLLPPDIHDRGAAGLPCSRRAPTGAAAVISAFKVNNLYRFSTAEIFGTTLVNMLLPAAFNVIANTGVKRVIAATDNINLPTHTATRTEPHWRQW